MGRGGYYVCHSLSNASEKNILCLRQRETDGAIVIKCQYLGISVRALWVFFVLVLQLFCKAEMISKERIENNSSSRVDVCILLDQVRELPNQIIALSLLPKGNANYVIG